MAEQVVPIREAPQEQPAGEGGAGGDGPPEKKTRCPKCNRLHLGECTATQCTTCSKFHKGACKGKKCSSCKQFGHSADACSTARSAPSSSPGLAAFAGQFNLAGVSIEGLRELALVFSGQHTSTEKKKKKKKKKKKVGGDPGPKKNNPPNPPQGGAGAGAGAGAQNVGADAGPEPMEGVA